MRKKITKIIILILLILVVCLTIYFLIFNTNSNKLKRYLKGEGYTCNKTICTKEIKSTRYQINYKKGYYHYEDDDIILDIRKDKTQLEETSSSLKCTFYKESDKSLTAFTQADTSSTCLIFLEKVNREVKSFQDILKEAKVNFDKLSK